MSLQIRSLGVFVGLACAGAMWAQGGIASGRSRKGPSDKVLAVIGEKEYTLRDVRRLRSLIQPNLQPQTSRMTNRQFLALMHNLVATATAAESEGLLEKEPYNSQWEFMRLQFLANSYANELGRTITVSDEELRDYYEQNKARYESVQVSAIYIHYTPEAGSVPSPSAKQRPTEAQAKAKAEKLLAEIKTGADFAELAREHSDDKISSQKGGDMGSFNMDSSIPRAIKAAILGLQDGEVSDIVKDAGRFYIFKATGRQARAFEEVRSELEPTLRSRKLLLTTQKAQMSVPIKFTDDPALDESPGTGAGSNPPK